MPFSNTTDKNGIIQACERWTNLGDAGITGDATLLKWFAAAINEAFDEVLPILYASDSKWQWDDANHADQPIATFDLVAGQASYAFEVDEDGNSILELRSVHIQSENGDWQQLRAVDADEAGTVLAPNSSSTGAPTRYDKIGGAIWLDVVPNYSRANAVRLVFSRSQSYFASTDTTKTPGIPRPFHQLLALIPSRDFIAIHKPDNRQLIQTINEKIAEQKAMLRGHMNKRSRDEKTVMRVRSETSR